MTVSERTRGVGVVRLIAGLAAVAAAAAVLTASSPPDRFAQQAAAFDQVFAAYQGWFVGERDERGVAYDHWRYDDALDPGGVLASDGEIDYARLGRTPEVAVLRRERNARPGFSLDVIHPAGSELDFVLIGDRYREPVTLPQDQTLHPSPPGEPLARTLWIARPTTLADSGGWDRCASGATSRTCRIDKAIAATRAAVPDVPRTYDRGGDGTVTARTGVRLIDLLTYDLAPFNSYQVAVLQPVLYDLVPFTIVFAPDATLRFAELNGRLTAPGASIEVHVGQQHLGVATAADFPAPPSGPAEIQQMGRLEWVLFSENARLLERVAHSGEVPPGGPG